LRKVERIAKAIIRIRMITRLHSQSEISRNKPTKIKTSGQNLKRKAISCHLQRFRLSPRKTIPMMKAMIPKNLLICKPPPLAIIYLFEPIKQSLQKERLNPKTEKETQRNKTGLAKRLIQELAIYHLKLSFCLCFLP